MASSFPTRMAFIYFSCHLPLQDSQDSAEWRRREQACCPVPDLGQKHLLFPHRVQCHLQAFHRCPLSHWEVILLPNLLSVFIMKRCSMWFNVFSAVIEMIVWILFFILWMWDITFIDEPALHPWGKSHLATMCDPLNMDSVVSILLRILDLCSKICSFPEVSPPDKFGTRATLVS